MSNVNRRKKNRSIKRKHKQAQVELALQPVKKPKLKFLFVLKDKVENKPKWNMKMTIRDLFITYYSNIFGSKLHNKWKIRTSQKCL